MSSNDPQDDYTSSLVALSRGKMISHYRIVERIGAGGMGEVYLAEDTKLERRVALKFIPPQLCQDTDSRKRFEREAQAVAKLSHPNIVTIYEVNEFENRPFYAMAYVEGQTLARFSSESILTIETVVDIGIQISTALTAAHLRGVTHRDLKPSNIIIDPSGKLHVLDFGLAVVAQPADQRDSEATVTRLTSMGVAAGTLPYMAPEQLTGESVGPLVDIFALGVILYELSCGERPFTGDSGTEIATSILRDTPTPVSKKRRDVPYDLARIISRCLQKNPGRRFQSVADVGNELEELRELMEKGDAQVEIDRAAVTGNPALKEMKFGLTADLVRSLDHKSPQMIGDHLTYLDNGIKSDLLVIFLHGLGLDQRQFVEVLRMLPHRGIAPSLYGFDVGASRRQPLLLKDHSVLLRALFRSVAAELRPRHIVLAGHSSGADHILHMVASEEGIAVDVDGVLCFGCNTHLDTCVLSSKLAALTSGDEDSIIEAIREFGHMVGSLKDYLTVCEYMVTGFQKFEGDIEPLRQLAIGFVQPLQEHGWEQFPRWYRAVVQRVAHRRFVFSRYEVESVDEILRLHLENNVLGDAFREDTIVREDVSHFDLSNPQLVLKHLLDIVGQIRA